MEIISTSLLLAIFAYLIYIERRLSRLEGQVKMIVRFLNDNCSKCRGEKNGRKIS